jgi:hypothetical protein
MYFDSVEEYTAEIALVRDSIRRTLESQQYSRGGSGADVSSQRVDLKSLESYLQRLIAERDILQAGTDTPLMRISAKAGRRFP